MFVTKKDILKNISAVFVYTVKVHFKSQSQATEESWLKVTLLKNIQIQFGF